MYIYLDYHIQILPRFSYCCYTRKLENDWI